MGGLGFHMDKHGLNLSPTLHEIHWDKYWVPQWLKLIVMTFFSEHQCLKGKIYIMLFWFYYSLWYPWNASDGINFLYKDCDRSLLWENITMISQENTHILGISQLAPPFCFFFQIVLLIWKYLKYPSKNFPPIILPIYNCYCISFGSFTIFFNSVYSVFIEVLKMLLKNTVSDSILYLFGCYCS